MGGFGKAIKRYQDLLLEYRKIYKSKSATSASKTLAKTKVTNAFKQLQLKFGNELQFATRRLNSKQSRSSPLVNVDRGTNIARSSRNTTKLNLVNSAHTKSLMSFAKSTKYLGNGLAVIDFGSRIGNVHNEYKAGEYGNWERELFIESASFGLSASMGVGAVALGSSLLTVLIVATPVGWVGLIVAGIAIAGTAAATSIVTNNIVKNNAGSVYDSIMSWVSPQ